MQPANAKTPLPVWVPVVAIIVVVVIVAAIGWKVLGGGGSDRVPVSVEKVKEQIRQGGIRR
jgi:hypothetical protein